MIEGNTKVHRRVAIRHDGTLRRLGTLRHLLVRYNMHKQAR